LWCTGKLQEKAELRNPDEFYHKMRNAKFEDGAHVIMRSNEASNEKARKLSQKANMALVQMGRQVESKKAEKLQSSLHMVDLPKANTHLKFVASHKEITASNDDEMQTSAAQP
jgi:hypothetical protein